MIINEIRKEIEDFKSQNIQIVEGFYFNQRATIEQIYLYYNSKFETGDIDDEGMRKYFFNIVRNPCKVTTKAIDFDTKHIKIQTAAGGEPLRTWFFERDLKFWMKDQNFGKTLNRIFAELPIFGSVVLKVVNGKPYFVDLRNFIVTQDADTLSGSDIIIETHYYTPMEFRRVGKEMGWDNIEDAIERYRFMDKPYITVYERYGEVGTTDEKGNKTYSYKRLIMADVGVDRKDSKTGDTVPYSGVTLSEVEVDTHPYWEFHLEKIPGRWLGVGIVEILVDAQIRENEIANLQAKSSLWTALRIWQTRDEGVNRNLFTDMLNGEILNVESEITQVDMADRNLAMYNQETDKWLKNRDELTFSYDVIRGERLPAGTPLGSARLAAAMTGSHFDQVRENVALEIKEFLYKVIIPKFLKENSKEHYLRLVGEDLDKYNDLLIIDKAKKGLIRFVATKKKIPSKEQYEVMKAAIEERVKQGTEKLVSIVKDAYKDIKYKIDIIITGEQKDTMAMTQVYFAALQAITADPTLLTDPRKKKIFYKALENSGVNPLDLEPEVEARGMERLIQRMPLPRGAGGGVSRPATPIGAGLGTAERRI